MNGRDRSRPRNPGLQHGEIKPQTSDWKHLWGLRWQWEKLPASQESSLERPTGSQNIHKPTHSGISTRRAQFDCGYWRKWLKTGREQSKLHYSLLEPSPLATFTFLYLWIFLFCLFVCLFCFLDSTYKWNYMVLVFLWLAYSLSIILSRSINAVAKDKISFFFTAE